LRPSKTQPQTTSRTGAQSSHRKFVVLVLNTCRTKSAAVVSPASSEGRSFPLRLESFAFWLARHEAQANSTCVFHPQPDSHQRRLRTSMDTDEPERLNDQRWTASLYCRGRG
ncbi:unnamed protein product, partial [Ectocarpus sp. 8 AP-2014]